MADKKQTMLYGLLTSIADKITYDNSTSGLTATNVQDAIDELSTLPKQSTIEKVVGTDWRGKIIYQRTFDSAISTYTDSTARRIFVKTILQNVDTIENLKGWYSIINNNQKYSANSPFIGGNGEFLRMGTVYVQDDLHELKVFIGTLIQDNVTSVDYHFVVDYTKTTD